MVARAPDSHTRVLRRVLKHQFAAFLLALSSATIPVCSQVGSTSLAVNPGSAQLGSPATLEATVNPRGAGKVYFRDGATLLGVTAVGPDGKAVITTTLLPSGTRHLRAFYAASGPSSASASISVPLNVVARPAAGFLTPLDYAGGGNADSIAVADLNHDGHPDLILVNRANSVSVLLGSDSGFQPSVDYPVGVAPKSIAVGDFNGDGYSDLAVANAGSGSISVLLGSGDGSFRNAVNITGVESAFAIAAGDVNADGKEDLVVSSDTGNTVSVLIGNGDATFQTARVFPTGEQPRSILIADLNGDGKQDLAVANTGGNSITVLLGDGTGGFAPAAFLPATAGVFPAALVAGDFNGDGKVDLAVANTGSNDVTVLLGDGDGKFRMGAVYAAGSEPVSISLIDFNGDGRPDLMVANRSGEISLLLGGGDGSFQLAGKYAGGAEPSGIVVADFNGDGRADIAVSNAASRDGAPSTRVLLASSAPLASAATATTLNAGPSPSTLGDVVTLSATVTPADATGKITFTDGATPLGTATLAGGKAAFATTLLTAGTHALRATYGGDSTHAPSSTTAAVFQAVNAAPSPGFSNPIRTFPADGSASAIVIGDFNGDGRADLAVSNPGMNAVSILLGIGDGTFITTSQYSVSSGAGPIAVADVNGDGLQDVVVGSALAVDVLLGDGHGMFTAVKSNSIAGPATSIVTADFNGDGKPDIAFANGSNKVTVMLGNGDGTFQPPTSLTGDANFVAIASADLKNRGVADLVVPGFVFLGNGNGTFQTAQAFAATGSSPAAIATGDFNGDGNVDLAIANRGNPATCVSVALGNGDGTFRSPASPAPACAELPRSIAVVDLNGDKRLDLVVVNDQSSRVTAMIGLGDGSFRLAGSLPLPAASQPLATSQTLAVGDFNSDGRSDLAVAAYDAVSVVLSIAPATPKNVAVMAMSGTPQSTKDNTLFPQSLAVKVTDSSGRPVASVPVTFTAPGGGTSGLFPNGTTTAIIQTDFNGVAQTAISANGMPGPYAVVATAPGGTTQAVFNLTNIGPPASILLVGTAGGHATVLKMFAPLQVLVLDAKGTGVPGVMVNFVAPATAASATFPSGSTAATDSTGVASEPVMANTKAGSYMVTASVSGIAGSINIPLTNDAGAPAGVSVIAGTLQVANINTTYSIPLQVRVADDFGNPVNLVQVTFRAPTSGASGTFSNAQVFTDSSGAASATITANGIAGPNPGHYQVTASVAGVSTPATFELNNRGGLVTSSPAGPTFNENLAEGRVPADQALSLTGPGNGATDFTVTLSGDASSWLAVTPKGLTTPTSLNLSLKSSALQLTPGAYTGTITIKSATDQTIVPVSLNVAVPFDALPDTVTFDYALGDPPPPPKGLPVTSMFRPVPITVTPQGGDWLKASPVNGNTPQTVTLAVNPTGLTQGQYNGALRIDSPYVNNGPASVKVVLNVTAKLTASPSSTTFTAVTGQAAPPAQQISVVSGAALGFTVSATDKFVTATILNGVTPGAVSIKVDPTGMAPGDYTSSVKITPTSGQATGTTVSVSFKVRAALQASPGTLSGVNACFGVPLKMSQAISVTSGGLPTDFSLTLSGGAFLSADRTSGTTPAAVNITVDTSSLSAGTYSGSVTITSPLATQSQIISLPVTVQTCELRVDPPIDPPVFVADAAGKPISRAFGLSTSPLPAVPLPFTVSTTGSFVTVSQTSGATPATITASIDPTGMQPGTYSGSVTFTNTSNQKTITRNITLQVPTQKPKLAISPPLAELQVQTGQRVSGKLIIQNVGTGDNLSLLLAPSEPARTPWLTLVQSASKISVNSPVLVQINVDASFLKSGTYYTSLSLSLNNIAQPPIPVSVTVAGAKAMIGTDFTGVAFNVRQGQGLSISQDVRILDSSPDNSFNWTAKIMPGGADFLSIDPGTDSGTSSSALPGKLTLRTKKEFTTSPATAPGTYVTTVAISAPNTANSPRLFTAVLNVSDSGQVTATPIPQPTGLVFVAQKGNDPPSQTIKVFTSSQAAVSFQARAQTLTGPDMDAGAPANWITTNITNASASTDSPGSVDAVVHSAGLAPGFYTAGVSVSIGALVRTVNVTLVVVQGPGGAGTSPRALDAANCQATKLIPTFVGGLVNNFSAQVGGPVPITVKVVDDCGNLVPDPSVAGGAKADVTIQFSTGDPSAKNMLLTDPKNAGYTITWIPDAAASATTVTVQAKLGDLFGVLETNSASTAPAAAATGAPLDGAPAKVTGQVASSDIPVLDQNATLNNFNPRSGAPLAPGTAIQLFGANLINSDDPITAAAVPLPSMLGGTSVIIGNKLAPLYYVSKTQVNAQVPFDLPPGQYDIQVSVDGKLTLADQINIASVSPGLLAASDDDKTVIAQHANGHLLSADEPAQPNETIVLFLVGMGVTSPPVESGAAGPLNFLARVQADVVVDGTPVKDVAFAGLAPGFAGLYQVNFTVPSDVQPGKHKLVVVQKDTNNTDVSSNQATLLVGTAATP